MGLLEGILQHFARSISSGDASAINTINSGAANSLTGAAGTGGAAIGIILLIFFGPVFIAPLRYLLSSIMQSAAILIANLIGIITNLGVSLLQIGNSGILGLRPAALAARSWLGTAIILLCGVALGMLISLYNYSPNAGNSAPKTAGFIESIGKLQKNLLSDSSHSKTAEFETF